MHALLITLHYSSEKNILLSASGQCCLINPLLFIFKGSWSGSSRSQSLLEKAIAAQRKSEDWEIDWRLLKIGEKIAAGSCGDLLVQCYSLKFVDLHWRHLPLVLKSQVFPMTRYRGEYLSEDVAVKVLRSEHLNNSMETEFAQEVAILRYLLLQTRVAYSRINSSVSIKLFNFFQGNIFETCHLINVVQVFILEIGVSYPEFIVSRS